jgi:DNA-binding response OmpR family regulator
MEVIMPTIENYLNVTDSNIVEPSVQLSSLAIGSSVEDLSFLEYRFKEAKWTLYTAHTYREAVRELSLNRMPVVFCECPLPDGNWKDVLGHLALMPDRPRLIVFSRQADESLWADVLNLGGFDLLATPFREAELLLTIGSAWLDWMKEQERQPLRKRYHAILG